MTAKKYLTEEERLLWRKIASEKELIRVKNLSSEKKAELKKKNKSCAANRLQRIYSDPIVKKDYCVKIKITQKKYHAIHREKRLQEQASRRILSGRKITEEQKSNWINPTKIYKTKEQRKIADAVNARTYRLKHLDNTKARNKRWQDLQSSELRVNYITRALSSSLLTKEEIYNCPELIELKRIALKSKRLIKQSKQDEQKKVV